MKSIVKKAMHSLVQHITCIRSEYSRVSSSLQSFTIKKYILEYIKKRFVSNQ